MQPGYNSDVNYRGNAYHVQTEDWGENNPYLVSRVFFQGAVIKTLKIPYAQALLIGPVNHAEKSIRMALRKQHQNIIDDLISGNII